MLIDIIRENVANQMYSWLGARQGDSVHKKIVSIYNSFRPLPRGYKLTSYDPWCAATVSAAWIKSGVSNICPIECSCSKMIELAKGKGIWKEADNYVPAIGDAIIYDWQDGTNYATTDNKNTPDHVGIVKSVYDDVFYVIEGNKNKEVAMRKMRVNGRYIRGFITPNYKIFVNTVNEILDGKWGNGSVRKSRLEAVGFDYSYVQSLVNMQIIFCNNVAHEVIEGKWGNGAERKRKLEAAGYPYNFVQSLVNAYLQSGK